MQEFKVVKVINKNTVVIDGGYDDNIRENRICQIYSSHEENVQIDDNESERFRLLKGRAIITQSENKISVARAMARRHLSGIDQMMRDVMGTGASVDFSPYFENDVDVGDIVKFNY